jgi:hypothetical protein
VSARGKRHATGSRPKRSSKARPKPAARKRATPKRPAAKPASVAAAGAPAPSPATLAQLIENLSGEVVQVVAAPAGLEVPAIQPVIADPMDPRTFDPGDLVLGVGVDAARREAADLVVRAGADGAAAVILKIVGDAPAALVDAAGSASVALLAATLEITWEQLHVLLRTGLATAGSPPETDPAGVPVGDLFALANAVAAMVGGPTTIEDPHSRVLAYSSLDEPIDEPRRQTILGRRVPDEWIRRMTADGIFRRLWSTEEIVRLDYSREDPSFRPRLAIAVRAGGEILGSIWVLQGTTPFGPDAEGAIREAARIAALHLVRNRTSDDLERRRRSEVLRSVLEGRMPPEMLPGSLGIASGGAMTVVAFEIGSPGAEATPLVSERALSSLSLYCASYRRQAAAVAVGRMIYVLFPEPEPSEEQARLLEVVTDIARRLEESMRVRIRAGIGASVDSHARVADSKRDADQTLRALQDEGKGRTIARIEDVRARAILLELKDLASHDAHLSDGKLGTLIEHDRRHHSRFVETLGAFLDSLGDVPAAAKAVNVHPNTFRYRMKRLVELSGLALDDPVERLITHLQLKFLA